MCIFCGGTCGGIGDMLLPTMATGVSLVMLKIRASRKSRKTCDQDQDIEVESDIKPAVKSELMSSNRLNDE
jgi:hypothetical protein